MERAKVRKARKHKIEDWEEKDLESLSDDSQDEEVKKMQNYSSDIPTGKYEQQKVEQALVMEKVIVLRLKADLYRYLCEITDGFYNRECRESALKIY